jgi:hypothetical protein
MDIITLVVLLLVLGVVLYFARAWIEPRVMTLIVAIIAIGVLCWLLDAFGLWSGGPKFR